GTREKDREKCRQKERKQKSSEATLQKLRSALRETGQRPLVPHDPGRESSADALHLDAEGPNVGGRRRQFRPSASSDGLQERARTWPGGPPQRCWKGQGCT